MNYFVSRYDAELIDQIAKRAESMSRKFNPKFNMLTTVLDLRHCHKSCPLRLADLLHASDYDFAHDVFGITRHIDRNTGKLTNCFLPRYAKGKS